MGKPELRPHSHMLFHYPPELAQLVRGKLAGLKDDGIHHPNLNLFLINRHSACSAP